MPGGTDVRNVQVNLTANVSPYQSAMQAVSTSTAKAAQGVASLARSVDNLVKSAGHKMTFIGASDIAALSAAGEAANRFSVAMTQVRANSAVTGQSVGALNASVMSLSKSIPDSTNNIARLVGQIQALGVQGTANIKNLTKMAEQLAAATDTAPGQLLQGILQLNRQMGNGLQTVGQYSSAVVALSKTFGTSASDITNFATSISSVAQTAGYTQTQVLGLATAFTRAGADSAAAATVFTTITSEITEAVVTGSAQLTQFANIVGMTTKSFKTLAQSNPAKALTDILSAIHNQGQAGIVTLQQLGLDGPRSLRVISSLTGGQANLAQSMGVASTAYSKNTALTKSANAAWDDLSSSMQKMRNNIDDIVVRLGGPMADAMNIMVKGINMIIGPLNTFLGYLGPIPGIIAGVGGAVLAVTGIFTTFSIAILAVAGAWRMLSGMGGTNMMQGLVGGFRRPQGEDPFLNPMTIFGQKRIGSFDKEVGEKGARSAAARTIYGGSFGLGQRLSAPPPEDPNWAQRASARVGGAMGSVIRYPLNKLGWEAKEARDTLRHPFNYETRDPSAVNPVSGLGFFQSMSRGTSAAGQKIRSAGSTLAGALPFGLGARLSAPQTLKVNADTTEAQTKVDALRKEASAPVTMTVEQQASFVRSGPNGGAMPWAGAAGAAEEEGALASTGGMFSMLGRGIGSTVGALGTMAGALSSVALPALILGPAVIELTHVMNGLKNGAQNAANNMQDFGTQLAQTAGATYVKPTTTPATPTPADKITPFGTQERTTATDSAFLAANNQDVGQLQSYGGNSRQAAAQLMVQNVIANANSGQPLSSSEQTVLREQLIAAYGPQQAQAIYSKLNLKGMSGPAAAALSGQLLASTRNDAGDFQDAFQGKGSSKQIMNAVTPIANNLASNPAQAGLGLIALQRGLPGLPSGAPAGPRGAYYPSNGDLLAAQPNVQKLQAAIGDIVTQLNKGQTGANQIKVDKYNVFTVQDFINQLKAGSSRAQQLAANLQAAGLNLNDLSGSVKNLQGVIDQSTNAQQTKAISQTRVQRLATLQGNFDLASPSNANYQSGISALTYQTMQKPGQSNNTNALSPVNEISIKRAIAAWSQYESTINTSSQAFQGVSGVIGQLNSQLDAQQSIFLAAGQQASAYASQAQGLMTQFGTNGQMGVNEQGLLQNAQGAITSGESNLKSYMTQVHQSHIQMEQSEQDYNIQMSHMYRDFNIQQKEALYERNVQIKESNWEFQDQLRTMKFATANAFGNPGQMVQAQYTMSATTALSGMRQQVLMLQQSKDAMDKLHSMGLSDAAIRLAGLDDPTNVQQAQEDIADFAQNPQLIAQWNKSFAKRLKLSTGIDTDTNNSKFADMKREFDHTASLATAAFNNSQTQTNLAFNNELADFQQQYTLTVNREMLQLNEIGQNLFTSFSKLNKAALDSGLKDIEKYAKGIDKAIGGVSRTSQNFLNLTQSGGGLPGSGSSTSAEHASGGAAGKSGDYGEAPIVAPAPGQDPGTTTTVEHGSHGKSRKSYVKPGTGAVYDPGTGTTGSNTNNTGRYVPPASFQAAHPANPSWNMAIAKKMAPGWAKGAEWNAWQTLWNEESGWSQYAQNPGSSAYGIAQALPGSKMSPAGQDWRTNPATQIKWGIGYIKSKIDEDTGRPYGSPLGALAHENRHNWYAMGGIALRPQVGVVAENGNPEAMIPLNAQGVSFMALVMKAAMQQSGLSTTSFAMSRASSYAAPVWNIGSVSNTIDNSSNFSGAVTVIAQNPNEMGRQLAQQKRLNALTKPRSK